MNIKIVVYFIKYYIHNILEIIVKILRLKGQGDRHSDLTGQVSVPNPYYTSKSSRGPRYLSLSPLPRSHV